MARFVTVQTNFTTGELDPLLRARVDLKSYENALETAKNVFCQPQGGITRRSGTRYINSLPNTSTDSAANGVRLVAFEFSTSDSYMLCFTHNRMYIYKAGELITNINGSGLDYLNTSGVSLTSARLNEMCWTQSADTLIVTHEDMAPVKIVRGASDSSWTASAISFTSIPNYAFTMLTIAPPGTLTPSAISGKIKLTASEAAVTGTAQAGGSTSITLAAAASATTNAYTGMYVTLTSGTGSGQVRRITAYNGTTKVATVNSAWTTNPNSTSVYSLTVFVASSVGQYVNGFPQGRAKIISFLSATEVNVVTEYPFFDTTALTVGNWDIESGYENVWSAAKGWPRTVTFHQGRLYFGGSKSRPSTVWGSVVGIFFDFEPTEALDDDALEATLDTNTFNAITDIISGRDLTIFTTGGEFYVPQSGLEPITPTSFFVQSTSRNGSKPGIRVQQLESGILFIQRQGKALAEIAYSDTQLTYVTSKISLLSGHLLKTPKRMALRRAVDTDENDLLLVVNESDGSLASFSLMRSQNVIAPSEIISAGGTVLDVSVDITTIYVVVKRTISGTDQFYVERFDHTLLTDSAKTGGIASSISMSHLVGKEVNIILDGIVQANQTVPAGGTVTFPRASTTSYQVGVPITIEATTMPIELKMQSGSRIGFKKRIVEVNAMVLDTQNMVINGIEIPFRSFDTPLTLDADVPEFTGTKVLHGILGYSNDAKITITQSAPLKFTLLGMEYKVAVHQGT
jgi:hypothetical protein